MSTNRKKIQEFIVTDCISTSVKFHFGEDYYNYSAGEFDLICQDYNIDVASLKEDLENVTLKGEEHDLFLISYPVEVIIEYLKLTHHLLITETLPRILKLINKTNDIDDISRDLQFTIPLFVDDFIRQAHVKESVFFSTLLYLKKALTQKYSPGELFYELEKNTIHKFASHHNQSENKMLSIRNITNDYLIEPTSNSATKKLFDALKALEAKLLLTTKIENEILFPKALTLEKKIRNKFRKTISLN